MIDQSKLERQTLALQKWRNSGGIGTLDIVMRFGKTRIGLMAVDKMIAKNSKLDVIIVTPSVTVKEEWHKQIKEYDDTINMVSPYIRVFTANEIVELLNIDLLIIDEVHILCVLLVQCQVEI